MGVFHVFKIVQMVQNCKTHHKWKISFSPSTQEYSESAQETARIICECVNNLLTDLDAGLYMLRYSSLIMRRGESECSFSLFFFVFFFFFLHFLRYLKKMCRKRRWEERKSNLALILVLEDCLDTGNMYSNTEIMLNWRTYWRTYFQGVYRRNIGMNWVDMWGRRASLLVAAISNFPVECWGTIKFLLFFH